jgi:Cft2 family RNA processing exonuclease
MSKPRTISSVHQTPLSCFPYSVGHGDEGVCLLVKIGPYRILLDCGLKDLQPFQQKKSPPVEWVFCSHAHADHCRGLLAFHQAFPEVPIYTSQVTAKLLPLSWSDEILEPISSFCNILPWRSPITIADNLTAELFPAGHLPGAAAILFTYQTRQRSYKLLYTGDFSVSNFQLVEGLSIESLRGIAPDVLILEGSYGTLRHPHRRQQEKQLMERIEQAINSGKNVLLPVSPIGLGQEILKLLRSHHQFTGRDLDIWVENKVAAGCDIYLELLEQFPLSVQNFAKHQSLFWDERVCPRLRRLNQPSNLEKGKLPCVLLVDYNVNLTQYLQPEQGDWLILLAEHPQEYLQPNSEKFLPLKKLPHLQFETYLLAEHSDGRNTTQLIHNLRPQHVIFVHGIPNYLVELASLEELRNRYQLHCPDPGTLVELPIGDRFIQPAAPAPTCYEGELNEIGSFITITLPDNINTDFRWTKFADTGLVEARWQGDELVLRGISQKELLTQNNEGKLSTDFDCCSICRYYKNQRCTNKISPLYGFKVIPEGYCPVFEPLE